MAMPPPGTAHHGMLPPGVMPPHPMGLNPPLMMNPTLPGMMGHSPSQPGMMGQPPQPGMGILPSPHGRDFFDNGDFPSLGNNVQNVDTISNFISRESVPTVNEETKEDIVTRMAIPSAEAPQSTIFNNANPSTPPIAAHEIAVKFMPSRDLCYIVHSMLRPLQSLDTYNDDYYHWSVVNRKSPGLSMMQGGAGGGNNTNGGMAQPTPVWKEVKVITKEQDDKFLEAVKARAKDFAREKKSLGQLVKTNVKRPKALLTTPVLNKDSVQENSQDATRASDSKYESEQRRSRIHLWKARVSVDRGYTAFLSLIELRRLIQAHAGAPRVTNELMVDVKTNVDRMHSSLGVVIKVEAPKGNKKIEIDKGVLGSTLSLPKGRVLCARVIEDGILPHPSACGILPEALGCIFSWPLPAAGAAAVEGEDRLLHALTGLVLTPQPSIDPLILYRCLDMAVLVAARDSKNDLATITGSRMRMKLLYSILSVGKNVCADSPMSEGWAEKEKMLMEMLASAQRK